MRIHLNRLLLVFVIVALIIIALISSRRSFVTTAQSPPFRQCPAVGADTGCAILLVITDNGITVATDPSQGPFDQIEDTLIGVQNNSGSTLTALPLSATLPIFAFDGDGLCAFISCTWPHPTGYEGKTSTGGGVSFSSINATQTSGIVNFAGGIPHGGSAFFSLEERIQIGQGLCSPLSVQPPLKQAQTPWGPHPYDSASSWVKPGQATTIARWGCHLTSAVMLINYQAAQQNNSFRADPDDLNTWLEANSVAYKTSGSVYGPDVIRFVKAKTNNTLGLSYQGRVNTQDDFVLDNYLCTNNPVILQVPIAKGTHFVLATGHTVSGGVNTYDINDPGFNNSTLQTVMYGNRYLGIREYVGFSASPQALLISGHSPIEFLLTDPAGNRTGLDPTTGVQFNQIPGSSYSADSIQDDLDPSSGDTTPEVKNLEIVTPLSGTYNLEVFGTGVGAYAIDFVAEDSNGDPHVETVSGNTLLGATAQFTIIYSTVPGSPVVVKHIVTFDGLVTDLNLARTLGLIDNDGIANSLLSKLQAAKAAMARGDAATASNILRAFVDEVSAQAGKHIQADAANLLIADSKALF